MKEMYVQPVVEEKERPETRVEQLFGNLKEQYFDQVRILNETGLIELLLESERLGFYDINGEERPLPDYEDLVEHLDSKIEIIEEKYPQGFTQLQLTPFGSPLKYLFDRMEDLIVQKHSEGKLLATKKDISDPDVLLELDEKEPSYFADEYQDGDADVSGKLIYYPKKFSKYHGGRIKADILKDSDEAFPGWNILMLEDLPNLPAVGAGEEVGGRRQIETNKSAEEYLAEQQSNPIQEHERFFTPEDWIVYFMSYLKQHNQVVDDRESNGKTCFNAGAYFTSGFVPLSSWFRDLGQVYVSRGSPSYCGMNIAARPAVKL